MYHEINNWLHLPFHVFLIHHLRRCLHSTDHDLTGLCFMPKTPCHVCELMWMLHQTTFLSRTEHDKGETMTRWSSWYLTFKIVSVNFDQLYRIFVYVRIVILIIIIMMMLMIHPCIRNNYRRTTQRKVQMLNTMIKGYPKIQMTSIMLIMIIMVVMVIRISIMNRKTDNMLTLIATMLKYNCHSYKHHAIKFCIVNLIHPLWCVVRLGHYNLQWWW